MAGAIAVVTGGASEEGLSVAEALARAGRRVSIWDTEAAQLELACKELRGLGLEADPRHVDLGSAAEVTAAYSAVRAALGPIDALFNMATLRNSFLLGEPGERGEEEVPFWALDLAKVERIVEVNVLGTIFCSASVAPEMVERRRGSIVNFSTSDSTKRSPGHIPYGPSKAMVEAFSAAAAQQLRPHDVRVNVIASGGMVNRRGTEDPRHVAPMWAAALVEYLSGDKSIEVTGQLFRGGELSPAASLV